MPSERTRDLTTSFDPPPPSLSPRSSHHGSDYDPFISSSGGQSSDAPSDDDPLLNTPATPLRTGIERITRYEAMSPSTAYGSGGSHAGFIVTKTDWRGKDPKDSPISRFPNEILIHALSFLDPVTLLSASLISRRFNALVNSPQAWRSAFVRYFPADIATQTNESAWSSPVYASSMGDKRYFTAIATGDPEEENLWRKEYMLRTRLLRSLVKGKVHQSGGTAQKNGNGSLLVTYPVRLGGASISHLAINWNSAGGGVRAICASTESQYFSVSNPENGKIEKRHRRGENFPNFNMGDIPFIHPINPQDPDHAIAVEMGVPSVLAISEELGWVFGQPLPDSSMYINADTTPYTDESLRPIILPNVGYQPGITSVWIARKKYGGVAETTGASILVANSRGWITAINITHSKTANTIRKLKSWCLCPGIPIVDMKVDEDFTSSKHRRGQIWLTAVNAVGEVYYLRALPSESNNSSWSMIPQTTRTPAISHDRVFKIREPTDSLSPESLVKLEREKIAMLETMSYLTLTTVYEHTRMDYFLEVDFPTSSILLARSGSVNYHSGLETLQSDSPPLLFHLSDNIFTPTSLSLPSTHTLLTAHTLDCSTPALSPPSPNPAAPGHSARLLALATNTGQIHLFNVRSPSPHPLRTISTPSPSITTLSLTSLLLLTGGSDGLVSAYDPLGSTSHPLRVLHSKFSAKARRRIEQTHGVSVSNNAYAARCLAVDPDPTVLRGVVALGGFLRYWSFSTATEAGSKRKRRGGDSPVKPSRAPTGGAGGGRMDGVIRREREEIEFEAREAERRREVLERRYGVGSGGLGLDEDEMLAYAEMVSREEDERRQAQAAELRRLGISPDEEEALPVEMESVETVAMMGEEELDPDLAEAIRLSMLDAGMPTPAPSASSSSYHLPPPPGGSSNGNGDYFIPPNGSSKIEDDFWPVPVKTAKLKTKKGGAKGNGKANGKQRASGSESSWGSGSAEGKHWKIVAETREGDQFDEEMELAIRLSLMEAGGS